MPAANDKLSPEAKKSRNRRSLAIAFGLAAFILIVYVTTIIRISINVSGGGS